MVASGPRLPAASVARTVSTWTPSLPGPNVVVKEPVQATHGTGVESALGGRAGVGSRCPTTGW